jgi:hypothetical protein
MSACFLVYLTTIAELRMLNEIKMKRQSERYWSKQSRIILRYNSTARLQRFNRTQNGIRSNNQPKGRKKNYERVRKQSKSDKSKSNW